MIQQDVSRTFPEHKWFQSSDVQAAMLDILFYYAISHSNLGYRQGMHELLAPMLMVLSLDAAAVAADTSASAEMKGLVDPAFLTHDSFAIFSALMTHATEWFVQRPRETPSAASTPAPPVSASPTPGKPGEKLGEKELFRPPPPVLEDSSSPIGQKLSRINTALKEKDPELHQRLTVLDIAPQIFGLRWIRLLFSREFPLADVLGLWDAIFASGPLMPLVDSFFLAMLCAPHVRHALLSSPYTDCLQLLMRYPEDVHVDTLLPMALHYFDPKTFEKPIVPQYVEPVAAAAAAAPTKGHKSATSSVLRVGAAAVKGLWTGSKSKTADTARHAHASHPPASHAASHRHHDPYGLDDVGRLKRQVDLLQRERDELVHVNRFYGERLEHCIAELEAEVLITERLPNEEVIYRSLAALKEVKDVLRGNIKPDVHARLAEPAAPDSIVLSHLDLGKLVVSSAASAATPAHPPPAATAATTTSHSPSSSSPSAPPTASPSPLSAAATTAAAATTTTGALTSSAPIAVPGKHKPKAPVEQQMVTISKNDRGEALFGSSPHGSAVHDL